MPLNHSSTATRPSSLPQDNSSMVPNHSSSLLERAYLLRTLPGIQDTDALKGQYRARIAPGRPAINHWAMIECPSGTKVPKGRQKIARCFNAGRNAATMTVRQQRCCPAPRRTSTPCASRLTRPPASCPAHPELGHSENRECRSGSQARACAGRQNDSPAPSRATSRRE